MATTNTAMKLSSLLVPSKATQVEFPGFPGFVIDISFLTREALVKIRKDSTKQSFKNRQQTDEVDDQVFLQLYVKAAVKGWKGLKLSYLEQLAPIETAGNPDDELAYDEDNALALMKSSASFDAFISEKVTDLANFAKTSTSK